MKRPGRLLYAKQNSGCIIGFSFSICLSRRSKCDIKCRGWTGTSLEINAAIQPADDPKKDISIVSDFHERYPRRACPNELKGVRTAGHSSINDHRTGCETPDSSLKSRRRLWMQTVSNCRSAVWREFSCVRCPEALICNNRWGKRGSSTCTSQPPRHLHRRHAGFSRHS
jgi:hypothetical protein